MKVTSIYRKDKVGTLTHGSGNINMASSILTIGGLQYDTEGARSVALPTMTANTRYQVYAVISGGDVILVISQNENSVGPSGYTSWKLVGSFYSNGLLSVAFGSFVNIVGVPQTSNVVPYTPTLVGSGGTITNVGTLIGEWQRDGKEAIVNCNALFSGAPAAFTHTWFSAPANINPDGTTNNAPTKGTGRFTDVSVPNTYALHSHVFLDISGWKIQARMLLSSGATAPALDQLITNTTPIAAIASGDDLSVDAHFPVGIWSSTAIEDL